MNITLPLARTHYKKHREELGDQCAFCTMSADLTIYSLEHWLWVFAAFPYGKYHTILIPKRHILNFSDLKPEEFLELKQMIAEVERRYRKSGVISSSSTFGDQLFFSWRSRGESEDKKSVAHYHLHICPRFEAEDDYPLDKEAHEIDISLLMNT